MGRTAVSIRGGPPVRAENSRISKLSPNGSRSLASKIAFQVQGQIVAAAYKRDPQFVITRLAEGDHIRTAQRQSFSQIDGPISICRRG